MRSKSYLFLIIVLVLTALSGFLYTKKTYKYGLDVRGGIRLTYQMDSSKLTAEQKTNLPQLRANMATILENRVTGMASEGSVQVKEPDQFIIELPGATNEDDARKILSTTASLRWYHARNVVTVKAPYRPYMDVERGDDTDDPSVTFTRTSDKDAKVIKFGDPEYQKVIDGWELILQGDDLAKADGQPRGESYIPVMTFSPAGARKMERWTRANQFRQEKIAAVLDGKVLSIAPLKEGTILTDNAIIEGKYSVTYVKNLANLLNSGALPVDLKELSSQRVDPTIGNQALDQIMRAGIIAFGVIAAFMLVYYVFPGLIAIIALLLYILFTLTVLKGINATFSLAAIAGFILSVGMAVDANILVFERVKEEMRTGKTLMQAIQLGFKRALPAIIDSNGCTILTSLVLANLGTGPVKGFAVTLIIGVVISLFTAITVTRSLLVFLVGSGLGDNPKWYGLDRQWFGEGLEATADHKPLAVVQRSKLFFAISAITIIPGIIFYALGGLKPNVEFRGGYEAVYNYGSSAPSGSEIVSKMEAAGYKGGNVKFAAEKNGQRIVYVTIPPSKDLADLSTTEARAKISSVIGMAEQPREFTSVGPTVQAETLRNAILGVILSAGLIVLYLALRFGFALGGFMIGLRFAISAILALVHDIFVVIGLAAVAGYFVGWEVSALFISAMLTVIGFSTHDTIVIFDRIRENLRRHSRGETFETLINRSITQSMARSINTSATVIVTLIILIAIGSATPDLKLFNLAMLLGIVSGTYSSIFNASPILYLWDRAAVKSKGETASIVYQVEQELNRARLMAAQTVDTPAAPTGAPAAQNYGQVRRRSSAQKGTTEIDDQP